MRFHSSPSELPNDNDVSLMHVVLFMLCAKTLIDLSKWVLLDVADYWHWLQHWWKML